jgi:hypothetical protein
MEGRGEGLGRAFRDLPKARLAICTAAIPTSAEKEEDGERKARHGSRIAGGPSSASAAPMSEPVTHEEHEVPPYDVEIEFDAFVDE